MTWGRWLMASLVAGCAMYVVGAAFDRLIPLVAPGIPPQYLNDDLFRPWEGWTSTYMHLHPFGYGLVFAAIYLVLRQQVNFLPGVRGGGLFGAGVFLVGSLPVYLLAFASFQVSAEIIVSWILQSFVQYTLAGMLIGSIDARETPRGPDDESTSLTRSR